VSIAIRPEAAADAGPVNALLVHAFGGPAEAGLVDRLRRDHELVLELVATDAAHTVVGHVAFSRLRVGNTGNEFPAVGLAPLAVGEPHRRRGIGAALVRAGLERLTTQGEALVFVMGSPAYYTRFGFALETAQPFTCVYAGPYFMALQLADAAPRVGTIRYPAAFDDLG
jgi:putative acetyltransferase